jgi:Ca2+-binding EF-hand superfamily protein
LLVTDATGQVLSRYHAWDSNTDGVVTRGEWRGTVQEFRRLDANSDGVLTRTELGLEEGWQSPNDEQDAARTFATLDRNNNGRLTRGEFRGTRAEFNQIDRNRDNQISRAEFMNANASYGDDTVTDFTALDYDRTGFVERDEWRGTRAQFNRLDLNRDGRLTRGELARADVDLTRVEGFRVLDTNNNGVVTIGEWRSGYGNFNDYDVNRDRVITPAEFERMTGDDFPVSRGVVEDTLIVDSRQPWTDTAIYVTEGDVVTYRGEGTIQMSTNANDRATPAGSVTGRTARNAPLNSQPAGGLIYRIGNGGAQFLGATGTFTAPASGPLYFGVNDDHFADNNGTYRVWVSVTQR